MSFSCFGIITFHPFLYKRLHVWGNPFNKFSYFIDFQIDLIYNSNIPFLNICNFHAKFSNRNIQQIILKNAFNRQNILHFMPCFFALYAMFFCKDKKSGTYKILSSFHTPLNIFQILLEEYLERTFLLRTIFLHFIPLNVIFFACFLHLIII